MKIGSFVLSVALVASLAACGNESGQDQARPENVTAAPVEPARDIPANASNLAAEGQPQEAVRSVPPEPRRAPPAPRAAPTAEPAQPLDPHAGHDMGNMTHNQSGSRP